MRTTQAPPEAIRQFCQRYHIKRLSLVSALPDNDAPDESLDILVEFDADAPALDFYVMQAELGRLLDRKSTRLNSSHVKISYAVFCLKKKINIKPIHTKRNRLEYNFKSYQ